MPRSCWLAARRILHVTAATGIGLIMLLLGTGVPVAAGARRPDAPPLPSPTPSSATLPSLTEAPLTVGSAAPRSFAGLAAQISAAESATGAHIGLSLIELGGVNPQTWNFQGDDAVVAASTYKLPVLMDEAESIAAGQAHVTDEVCYTDADWEDGWFQDYVAGSCYSLEELATRIGQDSDNTAAHMLVRSLGGAGALNAYAAAHGARSSAFFDPNTTTANDLARLMASEATGKAGATAAQQWLYPLLSHTAFETGIPAGVPAGLTVVHKTGELGSVTNDVALVEGGPNGPFVLAVCVDGPGGDAGMSAMAQVSSRVWLMESSR